MTDLSTSLAATDRAEPWAPFSATDQAAWDLRRVVHLHRRAGFAASWGEARARHEGKAPTPVSIGCLRGVLGPVTAKLPKSLNRPRRCSPTRRPVREILTG